MEKDHNTKSTAVGTDYAPQNQQTTKFSGLKKTISFLKVYEKELPLLKNLSTFRITFCLETRNTGF